MTKYIFVLLLISCACNYKNSDSTQSVSKKDISDNNSLKKMLLTADTVLIVGHLGMVYDTSGDNNKLPPVPQILVNGRPNYSIIKKQRVVAGSALDTLISILIKPAAEENKTMCVFDPHHTIFLIKNGITSYIDFCFTCMQFESSNDLVSLVSFDEDKWFALERFFKQMGVRYEQYPRPSE